MGITNKAKTTKRIVSDYADDILIGKEKWVLLEDAEKAITDAKVSREELTEALKKLHSYKLETIELWEKECAKLEAKIKAYREWLGSQEINEDYAQTTCYEMREKFKQTFGE